MATFFFQDTVLTRDEMKRRKWKHNPKCSFCGDRETSQHLFFLCPVARVAWRTVASVFGIDLCPNNIWQLYSWCFAFFPGGEIFYTIGLATICWAIWNYRNRATFESKFPKSPFEVIFSACASLIYWAGMLKREDGDDLRRGAKMLKDNAFNMMRICAAVRDGGDA